MAKELGADSLRYLPVEAIARCVSLARDRLCRACITGRYPTETGQLLYQIENGHPDSLKNGNGQRAYESAKSAPFRS
jgi:amidophosphoribosyltransferase